jgi:DNA-directed RNA polymerase specialized sigma24 family protein
VARQAGKTAIAVRRKAAAKRLISGRAAADRGRSPQAAKVRISRKKKKQVHYKRMVAKQARDGSGDPSYMARGSGDPSYMARGSGDPSYIARGSGETSYVVERQKQKLARQDRELVERCMAGEPTAWSQMYERFHASLMTSIRAFLGRAGHDFHTIEEIAARVWYALIRNDFELLSRFNPARNCRLSTFLSMLAKSEARLLLRSEKRRKTREHAASKTEHDGQKPRQTQEAISEQEFLDTLTPAERTFYADVLVPGNDAAGQTQYTQQNLWQLRHRVRKKLERFLEG